MLINAMIPLLLTMSSSSAAVSVANFGAIANSRDDAGPAVRKAIAYLKDHPGTELVFPAGDYHFGVKESTQHELYLSNSDAVNPRNVAIYLEGLKNAKLSGKGARLLFQGRIIPFVIEKCEGVELKGFEIDWPRPLMSQGLVVAADNNGFTLKIDSNEFPYEVQNNRLRFIVDGEARDVWGYMEFDPNTRGVAYGTGDGGCLRGDWSEEKITEIEPGKVRFSVLLERWPSVGNYLVARHGVRDHAGTFIENSKNIKLTDMEYRHTSGLGVLAQYSENLTYTNVHFKPAPGSKRQFTGHDDGFHFSNNKGKIVVDKCSFYGLQDDPINVHGTSIRVMKKTGPKALQCRFMHGQSVGMKFGDAGDLVSFLDHTTLLSVGRAHIKAIRKVDVDDLELEFDADVPSAIQEGDALENLTWTPEVLIKRSTFGGVRARGLLLSTPGNSVVEDCTFRSSGTAILIAGDANGWYESGAVTDVLIRRNRFENCLTSPYQFCNAVISICPEIPTPGVEPFHQNIRIENNTFEVFDNPVLWALSAGGLTFKGNTINVSKTFSKWHWIKSGLTFLHCTDVTVQGNKIAAGFEGRDVHIEGGKPETIKIEGWRK